MERIDESGSRSIRPTVAPQRVMDVEVSADHRRDAVARVHGHVAAAKMKDDAACSYASIALSAQEGDLAVDDVHRQIGSVQDCDLCTRPMQSVSGEAAFDVGTFLASVGTAAGRDHVPVCVDRATELCGELLEEEDVDTLNAEEAVDRGAFVRISAALESMNESETGFDIRLHTLVCSEPAPLESVPRQGVWSGDGKSP